MCFLLNIFLSIFELVVLIFLLVICVLLIVICISFMLLIFLYVQYRHVYVKAPLNPNQPTGCFNISQLSGMFISAQIIYANVSTKDKSPVSLSSDIAAPVDVQFTYSVHWHPTRCD